MNRYRKRLYNKVKRSLYVISHHSSRNAELARCFTYNSFNSQLQKFGTEI